MKKFGVIAIALVFALSLCACGRRNEEPSTTTTRPTTAPTTPTTTKAPTTPATMPTIETNIPDPSVDTSMPDMTDGMEGTGENGNNNGNGGNTTDGAGLRNRRMTIH